MDPIKCVIDKVDVCPSRVFVVDDDESVRELIVNLLETEEYTVETFADSAEFLAREAYPGPACLVFDVRLPGLDGLALQKRLAELGRQEAMVFIADHDDLPTCIEAMKGGAIDVLVKPIHSEALLSAVGEALARSARDRQHRDEAAKVRALLQTLTVRENEVFLLVLAGLLNKQIAARLNAALRTVKRHRGRVMQKLGVASVAELVMLAQRAEVSPVPNGPKGL